MENGFSVIMPTYNQASFIRRAILSLIKQRYQKWELIIVDDGSTDKTKDIIKDYLELYPKIKYIRNETNQGMGYAINRGLSMTEFNYIAYLPSDDFYYVDHLKNFEKEFKKNKDAVLVYSGMRFDLNDTIGRNPYNETLGKRNGYSLQLVQTAHIKTENEWLERKEWVTENLSLMFWDELMEKGDFVPTNKISAEWTNHPFQRHKIISEKYGGGINHYRVYYKIQDPIKIRVSDYKFIDEEVIYKNFRKKHSLSNKSLKIILVGEIAFHPERIYALEEAGHQLYGLWIDKLPYCMNTVGHLPFGNVIDIPYDDYKRRINEIQPDIIYGLLNFGAIPLAFEVLNNFPNIPFVWHCKEGPFNAIREGLFEKLIYLYTNSDGCIFINEENKIWYEQFISNIGLSYILDGDLPKIDYFNHNFSKRISETDNEIHTVITGRLVGITPDIVKILTHERIHLHIYTENYHDHVKNYFARLIKEFPNYIHIHDHCVAEDWVREFSQYDAGWLHCFDSKNNGDISCATWDDLNIPARMTTLAVAGLPMIQKNNSEHIVAMQNIMKKIDAGIFFHDAKDLCLQLKDHKRMKYLQQNIMEYRLEFSFDYHIPNLISFFRKVIEHKKRSY
jgi:glycosyltransferase involved in cell wall biosynthesis